MTVQNVSGISAGTYTLSAYVNTNNVTVNGNGVYLGVELRNSAGAMVKVLRAEKIYKTSGWKRISLLVLIGDCYDIVLQILYVSIVIVVILKAERVAFFVIHKDDFRSSVFLPCENVSVIIELRSSARTVFGDSSAFHIVFVCDIVGVIGKTDTLKLSAFPRKNITTYDFGVPYRVG